jgi:predicted short-subunit dehydrogenase-like oxidoreductase (DUF2520 family)
MIKLGFIGAGKVGTALAVRLSKKGYPVVAVHDVKPDAARYFSGVVSGSRVVDSKQAVADEADLVFISTTDNFINPTASEVKWRAGQMVLHCSGANTTALLEPARQLGAKVGVFHPGLAFTDKEQAIENITGATFDIEAEEPLSSTLKELAAALDGDWVEVKAVDRPVFHVAEELCALFFYVNYKVAVKMMDAIGLNEEQANKVLLPLMKATVRNIEAFGTNQVLPGPVDRGDEETIKKHINGLVSTFPRGLPLYRELALQNTYLAEEWGSINRQKAEELQTILEEYRVEK